MQNYLSRVWAEISLDNLAHNYHVIRSLLSSDAEMMCVVKADAYGHGVEITVPYLEKLGADRFAVSNIEEAMQLRQIGIKKPILVLGYTQPDLAAVLARHNITQTLLSADYSAALSKHATKQDVTVDVHIKIDTGMSRIGFMHHTLGDTKSIDEMENACRLSGINPIGAFTHFTSADFDGDENGEFTKSQFELFTECINELKNRGISLKTCHCCNSAATLNNKDMHLNMTRPGIILYGLEPSAKLGGIAPLKPVMNFKAVISMIKTVKAGDTVSYGRTYKAEKDMRMATIPAGYADGFFRNNSGGGYVMIHGKKAPICGRVCMDQTVVDVSDIDNAQVGDTVLLFGENGTDSLSAAEYAAFSGTINYEAVCAVSKRVTRVYLSDGKITDVKNNICQITEE